MSCKYCEDSNTGVCSNCRSKLKQKQRKIDLIDYSGGECMECGYDDCISGLIFHHRTPADKSFTISSNLLDKTMEELKKEVDKCELLCGNCHASKHYQKMQV